MYILASLIRDLRVCTPFYILILILYVSHFNASPNQLDIGQKLYWVTRRISFDKNRTYYYSTTIYVKTKIRPTLNGTQFGVPISAICPHRGLIGR